MMTILTKILRDGHPARVTIGHDDNGHISVTSWRGTDKLGNHCGPHHLRPNLPAGHVAAVGPLVLTQTEADQVKRAYDEFVAAQPRDLYAERRALVATILETEDRVSDNRTAEWERLDRGANPTGLHNPEGEHRITTATTALSAFDSEHPEIKAAVHAKRAADVQRWADR